VIAINASSISKSYGSLPNSRPILRDVTLAIPAEKLSVILGRSGSGKSTLLNILAGLDTPDAGEIEIFGTKLSGRDQEFLARYRLQNIGLVFQFFNLLPTLSLVENVALPAYLAGEKKRKAIERAEKLLRSVSLASEIRRLPHEVSGGEIQRAAIARALINSPKIILADEPTGNLDQANAELVLDVLVNLSRQEGTTLLIVSHDPLVEAKAEFVFRLLDGALSS